MKSQSPAGVARIKKRHVVALFIFLALLFSLPFLGK